MLIRHLFYKDDLSYATIIKLIKVLTLEVGVGKSKVKAEAFFSQKCLFSVSIKGRSQRHTSLYSDEYGHLRKWHIYNDGKTLHRDRNRVEEFLLQL